MFKITYKRQLNEITTMMRIEAPHVARRAQPGQFIMFRIDDAGERVPLTIAGYDRETGEITVIFQKMGVSTRRLDEMNEGDFIRDFVGPLGNPSDFTGLGGKRVCVIGGGLGIAIAFPQAVALSQIGAQVDMIVGFRSISLAVLLEELEAAGVNVIVMTDDGSNGRKGFVTTALQEQLDAGVSYEHVIAIGPVPMMRAVCEMTRPHGIRTIVSMNTIMVDGTGMCGGCRLTVGGETKFACVDGPEFDGHLVDFDEAMKRAKMYHAEERESAHRHVCKLTGEVRG